MFRDSFEIVRPRLFSMEGHVTHPVARWVRVRLHQDICIPLEMWIAAPLQQNIERELIYAAST